jgi:hypothetical protein
MTAMVAQEPVWVVSNQVVVLCLLQAHNCQSYDFDGGVTFSAERYGKSEFKFVVSFYGSAQVSYHGEDIDLGVSLDEPINDYFDFVDEYGDEEEITAERLFELVKETEDYEEEIHFALPSLDSLIQDKK